MATKSKATRDGDYVCKIGNYDIRHKISQPKIGKNLRGESTSTKGSTTAGVYLGRELVKGGFNDHRRAIEYIWGKIKKDNLIHIVSKNSIKKYKLL